MTQHPKSSRGQPGGNTGAQSPPSHPPAHDRSTLAFLGIGNESRGDDGVGPALARRLRATGHAWCVDAGTAPENQLEFLARYGPDTVVFIDAVDFGGSPGESRLFHAETFGTDSVSTHAASLQLLAEYLRRRGVRQVVVLAIQPETARGLALSPRVQQAVERLATEMGARIPAVPGSVNAATLAPMPSARIVAAHSTEKIHGNRIQC